MLLDKLYNKAYILAWFSVIYNVLEGVIATLLGINDDSLALFGFGIDSFIEVMSGIGILWMIKRIWKNPTSNKSKFEIRALKVTGYSFIILAIGLATGAFLTIWEGSQPENTLSGVIISLISISIMYVIYTSKLDVGHKLSSKPIIADAKCTRVCFYMSVVLFVSSIIYWIFGIEYIDSIGALGLSYYSYKEGRESFAKARGIDCDDCC